MLYRSSAISAAIGLMLATFQYQACGEETLPTNNTGVIHGITKNIYNGDEGQKDGFYQGTKYWWNQDIISSFLDKLYEGSKSTIEYSCTKNDCRQKIMDICKQVRAIDDWNPVSLSLSGPTPLKLTLNPGKLCNHPQLLQALKESEARPQGQ